MSPARAVAYAVIRRVFESGAYADRALAGEAAALDARDRALAMQIAYGTVQRRATLDYVAGRLIDRPLAKLDPPVLAGVRIGLFQLLFLGGVAQHAAVNESVELVKGSSSHGAGLVNAVLRRAATEGRELLEGLEDSDAESAAVAHSVPVWLAEKWFDELGPDEARALLASSNEPAESALRVNLLVSTPRKVLGALELPAHAAPGLPEGLVLQAPFDVQGSPLWREGAVMPQSRASMLVARLLAPRPGERILDLCAAPGAKTTHLAALSADRGSIVAVERHAGRARALERTCARMRTGSVAVRIADAEQPQGEGEFDRVLVDPPCSGLGTLRSRPDLRWRTSPEAIDELVALQARILWAGAAATAPGGTLVYSVCTISRAESESLVDSFLHHHSEFQAEDLGAEYPEWRHPADGRFLQLTPHRHGTDGFFIARLRRGGSTRPDRYPSPEA